MAPHRSPRHPVFSSSATPKSSAACLPRTDREVEKSERVDVYADCERAARFTRQAPQAHERTRGAIDRVEDSGFGPAVWCYVDLCAVCCRLLRYFVGRTFF